MNPKLSRSDTGPRRILFIFPDDWRTAPRQVRELDSVSKNGYNATVISTRTIYLRGPRPSSPPPINVSSLDVSVYWLPQLVWQLKHYRSSVVHKIALAGFYALSTIIYGIWLFALTILLCLTQGIRLIYAHNPPDIIGVVAYIVSKIIKIPYIYEVRDLTPEMYASDMNLLTNGLAFRILEKMERTAVSNSAKNVFVSQAMKEHFVRDDESLDSKSIVIYSSWSRRFSQIVHYQDSELQQTKRQCGLDGKFIVLYLGSISTSFVRGLDLLIYSIHQLVTVQGMSDAVLVMVGDGEAREDLVRLAADLRIDNHVIFCGPLPRMEGYKWLALADVAVLAERKCPDVEIAVPNKILEYMAAGKAIVASDVSGMREVITNGKEGLLCKPGDMVDLAKKIGYLMCADKEQVRRMGSSARRRFKERLSWEIQQRKLLDMIEALLRPQSL